MLWTRATCPLAKRWPIYFLVMYFIRRLANVLVCIKTLAFCLGPSLRFAQLLWGYLALYFCSYQIL